MFDIQRELEAERKGLKEGEPDKTVEPKENATTRAAKRKAEEVSRQKLMMQKKDKRLYEKIKFAEKRKAARVADLESRKLQKKTE